MQAFPCAALTTPISVTTSASTSVALPNTGSSLRLVNEGSVMVFVSVGVGTQVATLPNATQTRTSTPVVPGEDLILSIPSDQVQSISAITRSSTATLHAQVGEGL